MVYPGHFPPPSPVKTFPTRAVASPASLPRRPRQGSASVGLLLLILSSALAPAAAPNSEGRSGLLEAAVGKLSPAETARTAPPPEGSDEPLTPDLIATRRAALEKELAQARGELSRLPESRLDDRGIFLTQETALLERLDHLHAEQLRTLQHAADLAKEAAEVDERTRARRSADAALNPPYGLRLLDELYGERDYLTSARDTLKTDVANAADALREARESLNECDRARRSARDTAAKAADPLKAQSDLRLAELDCRIAQETLRLRERALATLKLQQSLIEPKLALLQPNFEWLRGHLTLVESETRAAQAALAQRASQLDARIAAARQEAERVSQRVVAAERREKSTSTGDETDELESRRADREIANRTLGLLTSQKERLSQLGETSERRRRTLTAPSSRAELRSWASQNRDALERLTKDRRLQVREMLKARQELQELQVRVARATGNERPPAWVTDRVRLLTAWLTLCTAELSSLDELQIERRRLQEEIELQVGGLSTADVLTGARHALVDGWNYEVFTVQDQPVRVKTLLAVLLLLGVGYKLAGYASQAMNRAVFGRLGLNRGRRAAWQTLLFYALFVIVLLVAFNLFHLSLTQFSVISGALAVGLGFGSQNLISNFISGIILLLERPVSQGDVIEIDGRQVTVEKLGPRSTIVRSQDNTHVIVPNSRLLEQAVTNWTLSDDVIRKRIRLGVAYGSNTREVAELLHEVLKAHEGVQRNPAPLVKFADFGESALVFELYYWSTIEERIETESELRHRIAEAFARRGVVLAYPQRDVHLEILRPLQVELAPSLKPAAQRSDSAGGSTQR